jgi:hypothetical protein
MILEVEATTSTIRPSTADDLDAVGRLFSPAKPVTLLRWLLSEPDGTFRSYVALVNDEIVGHVGYLVSTFQTGSIQRAGVYPILWKVRDGCVGGVGLRLLARALPFGDFSFIMGGSAAAQRLYGAFGYRMLFTIPTYHKVVSFRDLGSPLVSRRAARAVQKRVSTMFRSVGVHRDDGAVRLAAVTDQTDLRSHPVSGEVMENVLPMPHLQWILGCPDVEAYCLSLSIDGQGAGAAVCYVRPSRNGRLGTVVHVPYLGGRTERWSDAVRQLDGFLVSKGCSRIIVMASDPTFAGALSRCGFAPDRALPFWFRGHGELPRAWHLTFLEGDLAYRKS